MPQFIPLTPGAKEVIKLTNNYSDKFSESQFYSVCLVSIINREFGLGFEILSSLNIDLEDIKSRIENRIEQSSTTTSDDNTEYIKDLKEAAQSFAVAMSHGWIGTEHLLFALIEIDEKLNQLFVDHGINREQLAIKTREVIEQNTFPVPSYFEILRLRISKFFRRKKK